MFASNQIYGVEFWKNNCTLIEYYFTIVFANYSIKLLKSNSHNACYPHTRTHISISNNYCFQFLLQIKEISLNDIPANSIHLFQLLNLSCYCCPKKFKLLDYYEQWQKNWYDGIAQQKFCAWSKNKFKYFQKGANA